MTVPLTLALSPPGERVQSKNSKIVQLDEPALMSEANQLAELADNVRQVHGTGHCPAAGGVT